MGFWAGECCEYCNGEIVEKRVELVRFASPWGTPKTCKKHFLIEDVPAGVCTECGTRYYSANVLKTIEQTILSGRRKAKREVLVPVFSW